MITNRSSTDVRKIKRSTVADRRLHWSALGKKFDAWMKMSDMELLREVQKTFPICVEATRDGCLKYLAMRHVEEMI